MKFNVDRKERKIIVAYETPSGNLYLVDTNKNICLSLSKAGFIEKPLIHRVQEEWKPIYEGELTITL